MNALTEPQSVVVLGGTSEIARAIVAALPATQLRRVVLAGRPSPALTEATAATAADLAAVGSSAQVEETPFDALDTDSHAAVLARLFEQDVDLVILAFGVLGDQQDFEDDPSEAVLAARVNYVGAVSAGLITADLLKRQGHGTLVVLSSVAGLRARRSNFVYGSTKAGLDVFAQGLADSLVGTGAGVLVVRPGFVRTRMTEGLDEAPLAVSPEQVAQDTLKGLRKGAHTVYSPAAIGAVMAGLRSVPRPLFRKLPI